MEGISEINFWISVDILIWGARRTLPAVKYIALYVRFIVWIPTDFN